MSVAHAYQPGGCLRPEAQRLFKGTARLAQTGLARIQTLDLRARLGTRAQHVTERRPVLASKIREVAKPPLGLIECRRIVVDSLGVPPQRRRELLCLHIESAERLRHGIQSGIQPGDRAEGRRGGCQGVRRALLALERLECGRRTREKTLAVPQQR